MSTDMVELDTNQAKFIELQERIRAFTKEVPSDKGITDPSYHAYLAKCARLYDMDRRLGDSVNMDLTQEEMTEMLKDIEYSINEIIP